MPSTYHASDHNQIRLESLTKLVERILPLQQWGFKRSAQFIDTIRPDILEASGTGAFPTAIYDSEYCRVKFLLDYEDRHDHLIVYYGRLHAPDNKQFMKLNDETCHCWHWDVHDLALKFLDGNTPQEAVQKMGKPPIGLKEFPYVWGKDINYQPEWVARIHSVYWKYYGQRLFELFDLRHPELWAQYTQFVKEFYDKYGRFPNVIPSWDKIC